MIHDRSVRVHYENALGMQGLPSTVSPATDWVIEIGPEDHVPLDEPGVKPMPQPVAGVMLQLGGIAPALPFAHRFDHRGLALFFSRSGDRALGFPILAPF